jgi:hypothetical protein
MTKFSSSSPRHTLLSLAAIITAALLAFVGCGDITNTTTTPDVSLTLTAASTTVAPLGKLPIAITIANLNGSTVTDTDVTLSCDSLGTVAPATVKTVGGKAEATFTAGAETGTTTVRAASGGATQTLSITIKKGAGTNPGGGVGTDDLDPSLVSWDEPAGDVGAWPITAKVVSGSITADRLTIVRDPPDSWPHVQEEGWSKPSVGNYWVIGFVDGRWHAATVDWAGVGKTGMETPCFCGADAIHGPLGTWRPVKGETAYLMMSTHARNGVINNNKQRTNIYKITMP